jgi:hypothetical protein
MKILSLLLAFFFNTVCAQEHPALDSWIGTIEIQSGSLFLKRCNLGQDLYRLEEIKGTSKSGILSKIPKHQVKQGHPVTVSLIASYSETAGENVLSVDSISEINIGKSCHLLDQLQTPDGA